MNLAASDESIADALLALLLRPAGAAQPARDWTPADWTRVRAIAREHRLGPLLHWRLAHDGIDVAAPADASAAFAAAFRSSTLRALALQAELAATVRRLRDAGIDGLALKGAHLALAAYPHPALRPMRDLDVLVREHEAARAYQVFVDAGYVPQPNGFTGDARHFAEHRRHQTPLRAPVTGIVIELHGHLFDLDDLPRAGASATVPESSWHGRGHVHAAGETVGVLSSTDLLLHLVVHASYHHHFDNGPSSFVDIALLLQAGDIDWPRLSEQCAANGWERGLQLMLHVVDRHLGTEHARLAGAVPGPELDALARAAVALSVQPPEMRRDLRLTSQMARASGVSDRIGALWAKVFPSPAAIAMLSGCEPRSWALVPAYLARWAHVGKAVARMAASRADRGMGRRLGAQRRSVRTLVTWLRVETGGEPS